MIYVYRCEKCKIEIELKARVEHEVPRCSECEEEMKKRITATNFILKGSGWAKDGYR